MNWDEFWGNAKEEVQKGLDQIKEVGVPAIKATAEQWLLNTVQKQHEETTAKLNESVKELQAQPGGPVSQAFNQVVQGQAMSLYGHWVIFGVAAIAVGGYLVLRK